jgi:hypothetical protein
MAIYHDIRLIYRNLDLIPVIQGKIDRYLLLPQNKDHLGFKIIDHARYPTEELYLYVLLKKFNRQKKLRAPFISTTLQFEEFCHFIKEYLTLPLSVREFAPVFLVVNDKRSIHRFFIMIKQIGQVTHVLLISTTYYGTYIEDLLKIFDEKIQLYVYKTNEESLQKANIQKDEENCSWFSLEMCFTLSVYNIAIESLQSSNAERYKNLITNEKYSNIILFTHKNLPIELAPIFRSCQRSRLFNDLPNFIKSQIISSKVYSLEESTNRRSALAFQAIYPKKDFQQWPNEFDYPDNVNYAIEYFKKRQIEKLSLALQNLEFLTFARKHWDSRTDATKLLLMK